MIAAVTFDLWDTLVVDDSDEAARAARGLLPKPAARTAAVVGYATALGGDALTAVAAEAAWDEANAWFRRCWKEEHHTPHIADRVRRTLRGLDLPDGEGFDALVDTLARMEVDLPPRLVDGIGDALEALHARWPLGVVSDAIVTPGAQLRELLHGHGLLRHFDHLVFSDEVGASKPAPKVFHAAAAGLGVPVTGLVHVGDREANDVAGPHGVGARAVLITAAVDRGAADTRADAVCRHASDLPALLAALESA